MLRDVYAHSCGEVDIVDWWEVNRGIGGERPGLRDGVVLAVNDGDAGVDGAAVAGGVVFGDFLVAGGYAAAIAGDFDLFEAFWR